MLDARPLAKALYILGVDMKEVLGCVFILYVLVKIASENVIAAVIVAVFMGIASLLWLHSNRKNDAGSYVKVNHRKQHQSNNESHLTVDYPEKNHHSDFNSSSEGSGD